MNFGSGSSSSGPIDDSFEDACSICLEPFTFSDPPSVTECKHEYHLHCILDWSQRRIECPICLQHLVLKDHVSQELLAGVENDKNLMLRHTVHCENEDEHGIMRHLATISDRVGRRRRQTAPPASDSASSLLQPDSCTFPSSDDNSSYIQSQSGRSSSSEFMAFSESLKSKISIASTRYKESISKSTRGLKEKLIARNDSVKELSRGVQREMSAGISRMIERLDIAQKRAGANLTSHQEK